MKMKMKMKEEEGRGRKRKEEEGRRRRRFVNVFLATLMVSLCVYAVSKRTVYCVGKDKAIFNHSNR